MTEGEIRSVQGGRDSWGELVKLSYGNSCGDFMGLLQARLLAVAGSTETASCKGMGC
jgi:hypothetical protein